MRFRFLIQHYPITSYFVLAYLIAWGGSFAIGGPKFLRGELLDVEDAMNMGLPMLAGPFIAGILLTGLVDGKAGLRNLFSRIFKWRVGMRWYAAALLIFPALILAVLWTLAAVVSTEFAPTFIAFGILGGLLAGFFEEIGWTGFAYPRMEKNFGVLRATIFLALLHGVWHAMAGYLFEAGPYGVYWLPRFIAMWIVAMMALRVILVWIYSNTGSLLLAQLTHASSTGFLLILSPSPISPANETLWFSVYAIILWIPAIIVIIRIRKKPPQDTAI
jgi:membrane protease YdiL (CAAX protease family)